MSNDVEAVRDRNRDAWNAERYESWIAALGSPADEAKNISANPRHMPRRLLPHLGEVRGQTICSVQGSHGRVAVALALLGAEMTVVDFSRENHRYATELAAAAGVKIDYRVGDIMDAAALGPVFDAVVMELGILHYHQDLDRFFAVMAALAKPGAKLLINEFHPVQRKLFWTLEPRDYFQSGLIQCPVPDPTGAGRSLGTCTLRFWTLGEIVTAVIGAGFTVSRLEEHPDWNDAHIPGTFTLVARSQ